MYGYCHLRYLFLNLNRNTADKKPLLIFTPSLRKITYEKAANIVRTCDGHVDTTKLQSLSVNVASNNNFCSIRGPHSNFRSHNAHIVQSKINQQTNKTPKISLTNFIKAKTTLTHGGKLRFITLLIIGDIKEHSVFYPIGRLRNFGVQCDVRRQPRWYPLVIASMKRYFLAAYCELY